MKRTTTETLKVDPYKLELPTELQIEPKWVIPLPGKHEARVYEDWQWQRRVIQQADGTALHVEAKVSGYRVDITKSNGIGKPKEYVAYGRRSEGFCETLLDLKLYIEDVALQLTPRTSTSSRRDEYADDE